MNSTVITSFMIGSLAGVMLLAFAVVFDIVRVMQMSRRFRKPDYLKIILKSVAGSVLCLIFVAKLSLSDEARNSVLKPDVSSTPLIIWILFFFVMFTILACLTWRMMIDIQDEDHLANRARIISPHDHS